MASNDDERRSTLPTSTLTGVASNVALTRSRARQQVERARAAFDALPNDVIVSIFEKLLAEPEFVLSPDQRRRCRLNDLRWVRETFPLVCRRWRDLYRSQQASSLHETLDVDSGQPRGWRTRPEKVIAWARTHARDVRTLRVGSDYFSVFTSASLGTVVEILAPSLTEIEVGPWTKSLTRGRFWTSLREHVAPRGQLCKLAVAGIDDDLAEGRALVPGDVDVSFLGQLTSLEELRLDALFMSHGDGLRAFPASVLSLTGLRRLSLRNHEKIESLPPGISTLRGLEDLDLKGCRLSSLPEELGALTRLTKLDLGCNSRLGRRAGDELRGLKSLRHLVVYCCDFHDFPAFIGELQALEHLDLRGSEGLGNGSWAPFAEPSPLTYLDLSLCRLTSVPAAVLSSMPRLQVLDFNRNSFTSLPENLGQQFPELREIELSYNRFATVPLRALVGASSLEKIYLSDRHCLQVEEPLDYILENFPRLREMRMRKISGEWTPASRAHLERFAERLKERDPTAVVEF